MADAATHALTTMADSIANVRPTCCCRLLESCVEVSTAVDELYATINAQSKLHIDISTM